LTVLVDDGTAANGNDTPTPARANTTTYTPSGPPLLDNDEANTLQNFFDNPNNLDPAFAPAQNVNFQGDAGNYTDNSSGLDWLRNMAAQQAKLNNDARPGSQQQQQHQTNLRQQRNNYGNSAVPQANMTTASADDYAAAQLLIGNQDGRYNNSLPYDISQLNGYNYPDVGQNNNASPYNFNTTPYVQPQQRYPDGSTRGLNFAAEGTGFRGSYPTTALGESEETALQQLSALAEQHNAAIEAQTLKRDRGEDDSDLKDNEEGAGGSRKRLRGDVDDTEFDPTNIVSNIITNIVPRRPTKSSTPINRRKSPSLGDGSKSARENLSEEQKRSNHIYSEQKRRNLIRHGFDDLTKLVPELRAGGFSKSNALSETTKFVKRLMEENEELKVHVKAFDNG